MTPRPGGRSATLDRPRVRRIATLVPVALLAALTAVQVFVSGTTLVLDARAAGLAFAVVTLRRCQPSDSACSSAIA